MTTRTMTARDLMTTDLVFADETTSARELASLMLDRQISGVPIQDGDGRVVGVVSLSDIAAVATRDSDFVPDRGNPDYFVAGWEDSFAAEELRYLHIEDEGLMASEIMTPKVFSVDADAPVSEVAETMVQGPLHRLLVLEEGEVIGIISTLDLVKLLIED